MCLYYYTIMSTIISRTIDTGNSILYILGKIVLIALTTSISPPILFIISPIEYIITGKMNIIGYYAESVEDIIWEYDRLFWWWQ